MPLWWQWKPPYDTGCFANGVIDVDPTLPSDWYGQGTGARLTNLRVLAQGTSSKAERTERLRQVVAAGGIKALDELAHDTVDLYDWRAVAPHAVGRVLLAIQWIRDPNLLWVYDALTTFPVWWLCPEQYCFAPGGENMADNARLHIKDLRDKGLFVNSRCLPIYCVSDAPQYAHLSVAYSSRQPNPGWRLAFHVELLREQFASRVYDMCFWGGGYSTQQSRREMELALMLASFIPRPLQAALRAVPRPLASAVDRALVRRFGPRVTFSADPPRQLGARELARLRAWRHPLPGEAPAPTAVTV